MLDPSGEPLKVQPGMEGVAQTQADMAVGPMLLELYNLGAIEEAELQRRLQASGEIYLLELYDQLRAGARVSLLHLLSLQILPNFNRPSPRDYRISTLAQQWLLCIAG